MMKIILIIAASVLWTSNVAAQKPSAGGPPTNGGCAQGFSRGETVSGRAFENTFTNSQMPASWRLLGSVRLTRRAETASTANAPASNREMAA